MTPKPAKKSSGFKVERQRLKDIGGHPGIADYLEKMADDGWSLAGALPDGGAVVFMFVAK